jgi:predicted transcriptional regulator
LLGGRRRSRLGALEVAALDRLWAAGPSDVKAMHAALGAARAISPKTVQSALERLVRKGLVARRRVGRAYEYRAALTRREWFVDSMDGIVRALPGTEAEVLLAAFVDLAERAGEERLRELERLVRARRLRSREDES